MLAIVSTTPEHAPAVLELARAELAACSGRRAGGRAAPRQGQAHQPHRAGWRLRLQPHAGPGLYVGGEEEVRSIQDELALIEAVTVADVRRVLDRFPVTEHQVLTTYGPLEGVRIRHRGRRRFVARTGI